MATRSIVAVQTEQGKDEYKVVYVHWDGNPSTRMPILDDQGEESGYGAHERAMELVELGHITSLRPKLPREVPTHVEFMDEAWRDTTKKDEWGYVRERDYTIPMSMEAVKATEASTMSFDELMLNTWEEYLYIGTVCGYNPKYVKWSCFPYEIKDTLLNKMGLKE